MKYGVAIRTDGAQFGNGIYFVLLAAALGDRTQMVHVDETLRDRAVYFLEVEVAYRADSAVVLDASTPRHGVALVHVDADEFGSTFVQHSGVGRLDFIREDVAVMIADTKGQRRISKRRA